MAGGATLRTFRLGGAVDPEGRPPPSHPPPARADALAALSAVLLVCAAAVVGAVLNASGRGTTLSLPPLFASFHPRVGLGTVPAVLLAGAAVVTAPRLTARLRWGRLLAVAGTASFAWTASLALIDGWHLGWAQRLSAPGEYLIDLPRIVSVREFLAGFSAHIVDDQPGAWATHVAGHPPLATVVFWAIDRIGLPGGGWAGLLVILVGATAPVAIAVTFRAVGAEVAARGMLPALTFFPGAIWVGVSADGMFAGVAAWSVAVLALALHRRGARRLLLGLGSGVLYGATAYLSYGLVLIGFLLAAVFLSDFIAGRRDPTIRYWPTGIAVAVGFSTVAMTFTLAGFDWFTGLAQLRIRYQEGISHQRAYGYFVWANFAALIVTAGPAAAAGVVRAARTIAPWLLSRTRPRPGAPSAPALLVMAATAAVAIADVTGLSKAETERIWLPFAVWIVAGIGMLPARARGWALISQVMFALLLNHLVAENW